MLDRNMMQLLYRQNLNKIISFKVNNIEEVDTLIEIKKCIPYQLRIELIINFTKEFENEWFKK